MSSQYGGKDETCPVSTGGGGKGGQRAPALCPHAGRAQAQVEEKGAPPLDVTIRGISPAGFLRAEDAAGRALELHPDGNSLDMLQGLLYTKQ